MDPKTLYLEQVLAMAPDVFYQTVTLEDSGQFNAVLLLDDEWVFRFPRYVEGVQALEAETRLLDALHGWLPLPIPRPVYRRFDPPEPGRAFMGYRRLPGQPLYPKKLAGLRDREARQGMAIQLAGFLRALHSLPVDAYPLDRPIADQVEGWREFYAEVQEKLFPAMRPDARAQVARSFEAYLGNAVLQAFSPTWRHGDFGGSNILFDPRRKIITGIIDFGFCALGDPAADLASVSTLGGPFFNLLMAEYEPDEVSREPLLARARFYKSTFALQEALAGYNTGDRRAYAAGMEPYL